MIKFSEDHLAAQLINDVFPDLNLTIYELQSYLKSKYDQSLIIDCVKFLTIELDKSMLNKDEINEDLIRDNIDIFWFSMTNNSIAAFNNWCSFYDKLEKIKPGISYSEVIKKEKLMILK